MSKVIAAVFEDGVFKPLEKVEVKDHERVEIKIVDRDEWQGRFNRVIEKIHKKASKYTCEEIDSDIAQAITEVREEKRDR